MLNMKDLKLHRPLGGKHQHTIYCVESLVTSEIDPEKVPTNQSVQQSQMNTYRKVDRTPRVLTYVKHPDNLIPVLTCFAKNRYLTYLPPGSQSKANNIRVDLINRVNFPLSGRQSQQYIFREERGRNYFDIYIFNVPGRHQIYSRAELFKYLSEHLTTSPVSQFPEEKRVEATASRSKNDAPGAWNI